ncbi:hypothetical protein DL770_008645 [Monosporascus sp. CRB-9-2]|nr:hypothetical protein DL770_008645 [Monosporascus sp. CRB-9-2]
MSAVSFLYSQLFVDPPIPTDDFKGQTVVITGANRGLGFEAARHLLRLGASRVILGVRSLEKGREAADMLCKCTGRRREVVEVRKLDMACHKSVQNFASAMAAYDRLDAVLLNAGIYTQDFVMVDGHESTLTINVINTFLLAILLLPALRSSGRKAKASPRMSIVASDRHVMVQLPRSQMESIFAVLDDEKRANMNDRYYVSKLMQILLVRALAERLRPSKGSPVGEPYPVIVNTLTPGYCKSELLKDAHPAAAFGFWVLAKATARTTEQGGRSLVAAISQGEESHGKYLNDCVIDDSALSSYVRSCEGRLAQEKLWNELSQILEQRTSGIRHLIKTESSDEVQERLGEMRLRRATDADGV